MCFCYILYTVYVSIVVVGGGISQLMRAIARGLYPLVIPTEFPKESSYRFVCPFSAPAR